MIRESTESAADASHDDADWWQRYDSPPVTLHPLLDAALDLFLRMGYHGTSVRAIASAANMTVPGLYYKFESKQDILVELLTLSNQELTRRSHAALDEAAPTPRARFAALIRCVVLHMTHMQRFAHLVKEIGALDDPHRTKHIDLRDRFQKLVLTEVIAGQTLGQFGQGDPHETTRAVLTMCTGVSEWFRIEGAATPEQIADRYVEFARRLVLDSEHLADQIPTD
ncbi:TetR/AcrR family transcriptional regulator [Dietzia psychralcaliphila]|uniref:TetR/AcrR family transcriptional regulator n=1 Tax=Dietzia psychralcaliphila TaxID=139021 RepID=UPI001C1E5490|nr:TetR/AcrR family transcriptional regulator [Dietzia psychralcaliphila]